MIKGSVSKIETMGMLDGPGIRTVIFLNGCKLRCKYCHNPEMFKMGSCNYTAEEIAKMIINNKPYYKLNNGGVTFSGGEPLLQSEFIIEVCKILKKHNIHVTIDTSGVGNGDYAELLSYVDLVLLDVKHTNKNEYFNLTGHDMADSLKFIDELNKSGKNVWIRQVIVPGITDNFEYLDSLYKFLKNIKNIEKIEFLPYHTLGVEKYRKLNIPYPFEKVPTMNKNECDELYNYYKRKYM